MTRLCLALFFGCMAFLAMGRHARADELKDKAQELLSEGNRLASEGDFGSALLKFRAAHELYPSPKLLLNIGTSLRQIGRNAEAAETYEKYLDHPDADPSQSDELRDILDDLDKLVGRIDISVAESDVRVILDGKVLRDLKSVNPVRVDPGEHTLIAEKDGRTPAVRHVTVQSKKTVEVKLSFDAEEPEEEGPNARVVIGWTLVGIGSGAVLVGSIIGGIALSTKGDAEEKCAQGGEFSGYCSDEGADLMKSARTEGVAATATFISGFAVVVGGLALAFTGVDDDEEKVEVGVGLGSLVVRGRF